MKTIRFKARLTGYDSKDTEFTITMKSEGTTPDITITESGQYRGELTLDQRTAKELAENILHLVRDFK